MVNGNYILQTDKAVIKFGGLTAVKELDMQVGQGEIYGLIGPNGAGKTTVFNMLTGVYDLTEGEIHFAGTRIDGRKPHEITRLGIARTFQNIRLFSDLTVLENVMTARHLRSRQTLVDAVLGTGRHHAEEADTRESRSRSVPTRGVAAPGGTRESPAGGEEAERASSVLRSKSPMFEAHHASRYLRQQLIREINAVSGRHLICMVGGAAAPMDASADSFLPTPLKS